MKWPASGFLALLWFGTCLLPVLSPDARADGSYTSAETRIKAAFLYKFCHYVEWPDHAFASAGSHLVIGVVAADELARELRRAVAGRQVGHRDLEVRSYPVDAPPANVQVLFVGSAALLARHDWLERYRDQPVLLVTDSPDGLDSGSSINFVIDGDRVRFDISLIAAEAHRLQISSQLLAVAREIRRMPQ